MRVSLAVLSVVFLLLTLSEWSAHSYKPATYEQLHVSEGQLHFGIPKPRYGAPIYLMIDQKKFEVSCQLTNTYGFGCGFDNKTIQILEGKSAKVRWQSFPGQSSSSKILLYELETNGSRFIKYETQYKRYLSWSSSSFYLYLIIFVAVLTVNISMSFSSSDKNVEKK